MCDEKFSHAILAAEIFKCVACFSQASEGRGTCYDTIRIPWEGGDVRRLVSACLVVAATNNELLIYHHYPVVVKVSNMQWR